MIPAKRKRYSGFTGKMESPGAWSRSGGNTKAVVPRIFPWPWFWYQFKSTPRLIYLVRLPKPEDSQLLSGLSPAPVRPEFPSHGTDSVSLGQGRASPVNSPPAASSLWTFCHKLDKPKSNAKSFEQLIISSGGADLLVGNIGCFMLFLFH